MINKFFSSLHLKFFLVIFTLLLAPSPTISLEYAYTTDQARLMDDLLIVDYWNQRINERYPVNYDFFLQGGYFVMPSARMGQEGEIGFGYSYVPPYINYNLRVQLTDRLEVSGNYRVFKGMEDPILTPLGFGDLSDKGANFKLALFHPEDSRYQLPGLAIGWQDFMGTRNFKAAYIVATQVLLKWNMELSLGYGIDRIRGFFGGVHWMPFRKSCNPFVKGIALTAEYDAIPYLDEKIEKHPKGRVKKSAINFGLKYRFWDYFDFSLAYIRGHKLAVSVAASYNFGHTKGFVPKIDDALPYVAPIVTEPIGPYRPAEALVQDLVFAFGKQGFEVYEINQYYDDCKQKVLKLRIYNLLYRQENDVRTRLNHLLAYLVPDGFDVVLVTIDSDGFSIQEYTFNVPFLREWGGHYMGPYELKILSPLHEVTASRPEREMLLYYNQRDLWNFEILPRTNSLFGSAKGKFKYAVGLNFGLNGFLPYDVYYSIMCGYTFATDLKNVRGVDRLNPSKLINVRTDIVRYFQQRGLTFDEMYLQKTWNLGRGLFSRVSFGLFEIQYGGLAGELLYYPVKSAWAIGLEAAVVRKRTLTGIGTTNKIRKIENYQIYHKKFLGSQAFFNIYYDWQAANLNFKVKIGKFLANDLGIRYEVSRFFPSGLSITLWYTMTNGNDHINGELYYDKGVAFSMPLDIFYTHSDRTRWGYGMSAWLRDVGAISYTGQDLYNLIYEQRYQYD